MGAGPGIAGTIPGSRAGAVIFVKILDENKKPLKQQALIRVTNQSTGAVFFQTTSAAEAKFLDLPPAKYLLEVGAAGYFAVHEQIAISDVAFDAKETVLLIRDPSAVDLKLKDPGQLPSKVRKEAEKGVVALELSNFVEARKHLEAANHADPSSSSINFLLGYLALQQKDQEHALSYLTTATKLDPNNIQAQNLLGQIYLQRGDYVHAAEAAQIVVASQDHSLTARKVLATSALRLKQFEKARENSQWIVDQGGSDAVQARLILGQALAGLHKNDEAIQTLTTYLAEEPWSTVATQVRQLITQLKGPESQAGANATIAVHDAGLTDDSEPFEGMAGIPLDIDAQKPSVAAGVQCPANILQITENPSMRLVDSLSQFSAIEHMIHENLSPQGTPRNRETRQFNYVVAITDPSGELNIQEYRDSSGGQLNMPDNITTTGLAVLAIAFHPFFRDDFAMRCEGLGDWQGQPAWLVHFQQVEEKPSRLRRYVVNKNNFPVRLKGRAWIQADNLQIVHLETDLVRPIPEIHLLTEHTSVSYGPVQFKRSGTDLWLPTSAELYVHFAKLRFHRSESFDHFMLFATDAVDKGKLPKSESSPNPAATPGGGSRP